MKSIEQRYSDAIKACGGAAGLLALPQSVKDILSNNVDIETKTKMLELVAEQMNKAKPTTKLMEKYDLMKHSPKFYYMFLDRLRSDCLYYLGNGSRLVKYLWTHDEKEQIGLMREVYHFLPETPEWITLDEIETLEHNMIGG